MTSRKSTKRALTGSIISLVLCAAMLIGTTFAWFTDTASTSVNKIQAGTLKVGLQMKNANGEWVDAEGTTLNFKKASDASGTEVLWEPGCTYELPAIRVVNEGNLAFKYKLVVSGAVGDTKLLDAIDFTVTDSSKNETALTDMSGIIIPKDMTPADDTKEKVQYSDENGITIKGHMKEEAGNEYQGLSVSGIAVTVYAEQYTYEYDSYSKMYDEMAEGIAATSPFSDYVKVTGTKTENTQAILKDNESNPTIIATIPGESTTATSLELIKEPAANPANVTINTGESAITTNVRLIDAATKQTVTPSGDKYFTIEIKLGQVELLGFYHKGTAMTEATDSITGNGQYKYNDTTGFITFTASDLDAFTAKFSYSGGNGSEAYPYLMTTASDLSGLARITNDGKNYENSSFKLLNDVNLGSAAWTPIGEKGGTKFKGTFDGNNKTVSGLNVTSATAGTDNGGTDHDGFGALFGAIEDGTVENLTVSGTVNCDNAGGIVARMNGGTIENCTSNVNVTGNIKAGGIVCATNSGGTIKGCTNKGTVSGGDSGTAGIVGLANANTKIEDCTNDGVISSASGIKGYSGGIIGYCNGGVGYKIKNCNNNKAITGYTAAGGIVGLTSSVTDIKITSCNNNNGAISATGVDSSAGGIVGYCTGGTLTSCKNTGTVSGTHAGGVVGRTQQTTSSIINCSGGTAAITGTNKGRLIGRVKYAKLTIDDGNGDSYEGITTIGAAECVTSEGKTDDTSICIVSGTLRGNITGGMRAVENDYQKTHIIIKTGASWVVDNNTNRTGNWHPAKNGWVQCT